MVVSMDVETAVLTACQIRNKNPADYAHLDNGRRKMVASNLLRAACKKDAAVLDQIRAMVGGCAIDGPATEDEPEMVLDWPASKRFQFALVMGDGSVKFKYIRPATVDADVAMIVERKA